MRKKKLDFKLKKRPTLPSGRRSFFFGSKGLQKTGKKRTSKNFCRPTNENFLPFSKMFHEPQVHSDSTELRSEATKSDHFYQSCATIRLLDLRKRVERDRFFISPQMPLQRTKMTGFVPLSMEHVLSTRLLNKTKREL